MNGNNGFWLCFLYNFFEWIVHLQIKLDDYVKFLFLDQFWKCIKLVIFSKDNNNYCIVVWMLAYKWIFALN